MAMLLRAVADDNADPRPDSNAAPGTRSPLVNGLIARIRRWHRSARLHLPPLDTEALRNIGRRQEARSLRKPDDHACRELRLPRDVDVEGVDAGPARAGNRPRV